MKTLITAIALSSLVALGACTKGDDTLADNVEAAADNRADALDALADNTTNEIVEERLEDQADAIRDAGEAKADAIDAADGNLAAVNAAGR